MAIAAFTFAAGYLALAAALFFAQRSILFQPPLPATLPRPQQGVLLRLPGPPAAPEVIATWLPPAAPEGNAVVFFHGNAEQLTDFEGRGERLHAAGLGVLCVEYPGYGVSPGAPSRASIVAAAGVALAYLHGPLGVPRERSVLLAHSLGTGVAAELAARGEAARLVLISPYTSIREMATQLAPFLPVSLLVRDRFDTAALAPSLRLPVLIVHGSDDEVIPSWMGRRLAQLIPGARLLWIEGGMHNDLFAAHGGTLWPALLEFAGNF